MAAPSVRAAGLCSEAWRAVLAEAAGALALLDAAAARSLHWGCGAAALLRAGALAVRDLGAAPGEAGALLLVVLCAAPPREALRALLARGRPRRCLLFLAAEPAEGEAAELEALLRRGAGAAEVRVLPGLAWAPLAPHLLLSPAQPPAEPAAAKQPEPPALPQARGLARALAALLEALGVREESFALGPHSRLIAAELAAGGPQAKNRRKAAPHRGALLLIDRSLDLTGAVGHHGDNLVEKIISVLPRLPGHSNDVAVNMVELTALRPDVESCNIIAPGCLAQPNDPAAKVLWESLLSMKHKEAVMEVRRHLVEAASRENLPIKMSMGRVTPEQLGTYVQLFKNNLEALENHCGLLQLGLATAQTLKHPDYAKWDNFLAFERLLLQNLGESDLPKVLSQLLPMIKSHNNRTDNDYSPEDLLVLLVYMYSVAGEISLEKELDAAECEIKKALVRVFSDEPELSSLLQKITGCKSSPELTYQKANIAVDAIFKTLREIMRARTHMKQFSSVYVPGSNTTQASYKPLLKQVVEEIFHPDRPDTPDIEHMSTGLTDLLKTGFSMFMKVSRPHPSDYPLLILFMVGGVTISEVKMVKDLIAAQKPNVQVIVMSTRLLKPLDIPELLFSADRPHPIIGF